MGLPNAPHVEQLLQPDVFRREAQLLRVHQFHPGLAAGRDHAIRLGQIQAHRFLQHDVFACGRGVHGDLTMEVVGNAQYDHVDLIHLQHLAVVGEGMRDAVPPGEGLGVASGGRGHGQQLRVRRLPEGLRMDRGDELGADEANSDFLAHNVHLPFSCLQRPAFAVLVVEKPVCLGHVGDLQVCAVPDQSLAAVANADGAQQHRLRQRAGEIETRPRGRALLAGLDPLVVVADGTRQGLGRPLVGLHRRLGDQPGALAAPALDEHLALVADEEDAVLGVQLAAVLQLLRARRQQAAVVPVQPDRRHVAAGREFVVHDRGQRERLLEYRGRAGVHALRGAELQGGEDRRQVVNAHVAEAAGAEVPPAAPTERGVGRMIGPPRRRAEPQVPVQRRGHGRRVLGPLDALGPPQRHLAAMRGAVRPDVHLPHGADGAVPDPFVDQPVALERHALVAHLRGDLGLARRLGHGAGLVHRAGQRLLAIDVLAHLDGRHRHDGVGVVRRAHDHGVDVLLLVQHLAEVLVASSPWGTS